jgi:hypothetical protein
LYPEARVPTPRPIGTGKTSLVTPITNLLEFNIYDLEITTVQSNTEEWSSGIVVAVAFAVGSN